MIYRVTARLNPDTAAELQRKLTDGTIAEQKPDGREMVASMGRAVVLPGGDVTWSETCYCDTPLAHERATVLDLHFDDLVTEPIAEHESHEGRSFLSIWTKWWGKSRGCLAEVSHRRVRTSNLVIRLDYARLLVSDRFETNASEMVL